MVALIRDNILAIQDLCKKHHVRSLYLVGSASAELSFTDQVQERGHRGDGLC